jgi:hypothetical protein
MVVDIGVVGDGIAVADPITGNVAPVVGVAGEFPNVFVVAVLIDIPPKGVVGVEEYIDNDGNNFRFAVGSIH